MLLTHTAGFTYDIWDADTAQYKKHANIPGIISCKNAALKTPLAFDPGDRWEYGINIDFAGKAVEAVSGQNLEVYLREHLFQPLGMKDTGLRHPARSEESSGNHARAQAGRRRSIRSSSESRRSRSSSWAAAASTARGATTSPSCRC